MRTIIILLTLVFIFSNCSKQKEAVPTDAQMIEHFNINKEDFEKLANWIEKDSINHYPLFHQEMRDDYRLNITQEREQEYIALMNKLKLTRFWHYYNHSIMLEYFLKGDAT